MATDEWDAEKLGIIEQYLTEEFPSRKPERTIQHRQRCHYLVAVNDNGDRREVVVDRQFFESVRAEDVLDALRRENTAHSLRTLGPERRIMLTHNGIHVFQTDYPLPRGTWEP